MILWIALLRGIGTVLFIFGIGETFLRMANSRTITSSVSFVTPYISDMLQYTAIAALCFAAAPALKSLHRIEERTARQNAAIRLLLPKEAQRRFAPPTGYDLNTRSFNDTQHTQPLDLAPHAPDWPEIKPRPHEPERDEGYEQRFARRARYGVQPVANFDTQRLRRRR